MTELQFHYNPRFKTNDDLTNAQINKITIGNRRDYRSKVDFASSIIKGNRLEEEYLIKFLNYHNRNRRKRDLIAKKWGNDEKIYGDQDAIRNYRPDFLILKCFDNSYLVSKIFPLEISTVSTFPDDFYLKESKVLMESYDKYTNLFTKEKMSILFIQGINHPGDEQWAWLRPEFIFKLRDRKTEYPKFLGYKPAKRFLKSEVKWSHFNDDYRQLDFFGWR